MKVIGLARPLTKNWHDAVRYIFNCASLIVNGSLKLVLWPSLGLDSWTGYLKLLIYHQSLRASRDTIVQRRRSYRLAKRTAMQCPCYL